MQRLHGRKVIALTRGDLTDEETRLKKIHREKSAEAIVVPNGTKGGTILNLEEQGGADIAA